MILWLTLAVGVIGSAATARVCFINPILIAESQGYVEFTVMVPDRIVIVVCPDVGNTGQLNSKRTVKKYETVNGQ